MRLLILAGTSEANALARALSGSDAVLSLAGRTRSPLLPPIPYRIGGFGGVAGLVTYLRETRTCAMIDATHPFAAQMSRHAAEAARITGVHFLAIRRPPWVRVTGDRWTEVADMPAAACQLGEPPRRVFLAVGRQELARFRALRHHYVIRSVERPDPAERPADATIITARGPFDLDAEISLLRDHAIEIMVTKNSGGVTGAKLVAARRLGVPVIMVARPAKPAVPCVPDHVAARAWLAGIERGV